MVCSLVRLSDPEFEGYMLDFYFKLLNFIGCNGFTLMVSDI